MTAVLLAMLAVLVVAVLALGYAALVHPRHRPDVGHRPGSPRHQVAGVDETPYDASFLGGFTGEPDGAGRHDEQDRRVVR